MHCKIASYADAESLYVRVKNPTKGKPLGVQGMRLHKFEIGNFEVRYEGWGRNNDPLFRISPDNTFTFAMPEHLIVRYSNSLCIIMDRVAPFMLERKSKGVYTLRSLQHPHLKYEYFEGMIWKPQGGANQQCVNPKRALKDRVNKERRLEWLRDLRAFKRSFKQKAVMGIVNDAIQKIEPSVVLPDKPAAVAVADIIRRRECTTDDIRLLSYMCNTWRWQGVNIAKEYHENNIINYLNRESLNIRKAYGVFDET